MMAAGRAAERGKRVLLIEKNDTLGKKLLITGGGRCNVTNSEFDTRKLLLKFKDNAKFLFSAFSEWSVQETLDFFHSRGMDTKVENELRTFPVSNSAQSVWDVLVEHLKKHGVTVLSHSRVSDIFCAENANTPEVLGVRLHDKKIIRGKSVVIATGGTSRPETGSTGDGYAWLRALGHTVTLPAPSLVPITVTDVWVKKLAGTSLTDAKITILQNGVKQHVIKGKVLFTHVGLSGPAILNASRDIGELLKYGDVVLSLDLLPQEDYGTLNAKLQELFKEYDKKKLKNSLPDIIPKAFVAAVIETSNTTGETACNSVTREERLALVNSLKAIPMHVGTLLGAEKAIISSGGVSLSEIDFKTMRSRLFSNVYIIGDMLDIDRPSGGYSLQLCWTTGYVAGSHC